jgi:HSP20 family protein
MSRSRQWPRDTATPFQLLQHELNRLLDQYVGPARYAGPESRPTDLEPAAWNPPVDLYETPDEFLVLVEIPGVEPSSIDLTTTGNVLNLKGVKDVGDLPEPLLQSRERVFGAFHRQVTPPNEVDFDKAEAAINHGVLKIRLPKRMAAKPRTIPVRPG